MRRADPGEALARYESLRGDATSGIGRGHGLALFLSRGMSAWIDALAALGPPKPAPAPARSLGEPLAVGCLQSSVRSDLTTLLAGMVLACTQEEVA